MYIRYARYSTPEITKSAQMRHPASLTKSFQSTFNTNFFNFLDLRFE
jgi:hypothetical protein